MAKELVMLDEQPDTPKEMIVVPLQPGIQVIDNKILFHPDRALSIATNMLIQLEMQNK